MKQKQRILKFMDLLSSFNIDMHISELSAIFKRAAVLLNMDRIILYKKVSNNKASVIAFYSSMIDERSYIGEKINISKNINVSNAFNKNRISSIPVPEIGEDIALPIMKTRYVLAADDINEARKTSKIEHLYFEFLGKATENSLSIFFNKRKIEILLKQAYTDKLTGAYNRAALDKHIDENKKIDDSLYKIYAKSIIFIDIDHFKIFNDTHGHDAGDLVLRKVFEVLNKTTDYNSIVYRYGGEEISIIVMKGKELDIAEKCRNAIEKMTIPWKEKKLKVTISIGVANNINHGLACRNADHALYYSKESGRNKVTMYTRKIEKWFKKRK